MKDIEALMRLADEYAHVYSFVGDDTMPKARQALKDEVAKALQGDVGEFAWVLIDDGSPLDIYTDKKHAEDTANHLNKEISDYNITVVPVFTSPTNTQALLDKAVELICDLIDYATDLKEEWSWKKYEVAGNAEQYQELVNTIQKAREAIKELE